ncbi:DUF397 domain-containing protein [Actinomadura fulvescens]|uniref:DUF397 domain-containing protein n=1 Tax=Actinomadura fulvescens TaxID=46160 RepID=A0ABN3PTX9_9ACTN
MNQVPTELALATWRKSSHSGSGDQCVEIAALSGGRRAVRDSKDPDGPAMVLSDTEWTRFVGTIS